MTSSAEPVSTRILIVDDMIDPANDLKEEYLSKLDNVIIEIENSFKKTMTAIGNFSPEIVILDIYKGDFLPENNEGIRILDRIWDEKFIPVIVYTASSTLLEEPYLSHPYVEIVHQSAPNPQDSVVKLVKEFREFANAVDKLRSSLDDELETIKNITIRASIPVLYGIVKDPKLRDEVLPRTCKRRIAASFDNIRGLDGQMLLPIEQFVIPPLEDDLLMGDILCDVSKDPADPSSYYLILTPSCDLVRGQRPKDSDDTILVAQCTDFGKVWETKSLGPAEPTNSEKEVRLVKRLESLLNDSQISGYIPIPEIPGHLPLMAANLKDLKILRFDDIEFNPDHISQSRPYRRISSVDSPFRERMAWAYMQISGRPGVPKRDFSSWIDNLRKNQKRREGE